MILLTGATGGVGSQLLPMLLGRGERVKCLVREPSRLGDVRVDVQIVMGDLKDLSDPYMLRQALRGVDTVIHLAGSMRDQPGVPLEELNGLATARLVEGAESVGAERFLFFSALGASPVQKTRFMRSKWTGEAAVDASSLETTVFRPSLVFDRSDPWIELIDRLSYIPVIPIAGSGEAEFQPVWSRNAAEAVTVCLDRKEAPDSIDLAGPETLTYAGITELLASLSGRPRPLVPVPMPLARLGLEAIRTVAGPGVSATWQEAELMQVSMASPTGPADLRALGIEPETMAAVLAGES
ncbi:MAG: NAD(P)H-binding protein [Solirubrobacterales bacterium]